MYSIKLCHQKILLLFLFQLTLHATNKEKVLLGCLITNNSRNQTKFLNCLSQLEQNSFCLDFMFVTDDFNLIRKLTAIKTKTVSIIPSSKIISQNYNHIINKAIEGNYDYLFILNSDICIHQKTITHLINAKKDIIATIYWKNNSRQKNNPNVWLHDNQKRFYKKQGEKVSEADQIKRTTIFLKQLQEPGIYEVGGIESCMLINKNALRAGVNFNSIYNLSFNDVWVAFCLRASALNMDLFVDTNYPAIYQHQ